MIRLMNFTINREPDGNFIVNVNFPTHGRQTLILSKKKNGK